MQFKVPLRRKDKEIETTPCVVEKTIELNGREYARFSQNLLDDHDFILENRKSMYVDTEGVSHCLLVLGEGSDDGILVESEGSSYARYSAYVPHARTLVQMDQYPVLQANMWSRRWKIRKTEYAVFRWKICNGSWSRKCLSHSS